jgi:hypothetical protein
MPVQLAAKVMPVQLAPPRIGTGRWVTTAAVVAGVVVPAALSGCGIADSLAKRPQLKRNFTAEVNAPIAEIPQHERAWPLYRKALVDLKPGLDRWKPTDFRPDSPNWPQIMEFVGEHQAAFADLRAAAELPHLGHLYAHHDQPEDEPLVRKPGKAFVATPEPPDANPPLVYLPLIPQHYLSRALPLLLADARRAAAAGDDATVMADITAVLRICRHMEQPSFLAARSETLRGFPDWCGAIGEMLSSDPCPLDDAQLHEVADGLQDFESRFTRPDFTTERMMLDDVEQRWFTDDGQGDGHVCIHGDIAMTLKVAMIPGVEHQLKARAATRKEYREKLDELFALAEQDCAVPIWELGTPRWAAAFDAIKDDQRWWPVTRMFPDVMLLHREAQMTALRVDGIRVAIAAKRHQMRSGTWPESLDALVPGLLAAIPADRFSGRPLRYRLEDGKPRVYSVFQDRVDDGGAPAPESESSTQIVILDDPAEALRGDLVLWPAVTGHGEPR